jgi:SOS response regulatory protein OraA/RecX
MASGKILEVSQGVWDDCMNRIGASVGMDAEGIKILKSYYQSFAGASPIVQGLALVRGLSSIMTYLMGPGMGKTMQAMASTIRPNAPGPGDVLGARALDPALDKRIWDVLRRNGIKDSDIELMFASTYQRIPEQTVRDIYFRHAKGEDWAAHRLGELGYTPERIAEIMSSWPVLPTLSDIIYMMGREAFEPDMIRRFGLDQAQPAQLAEYAQKLGMSSEWATRYWVAHWEHPGLQAVLGMYHRDIISWDDVYEYMSVVEIPPYWREKIRAAAYNVITRVDARRMYGTGTIDQEQLFNIYRHMGYSPEDALRLVDFTVKYESGADKDFTREDIIRAYKYGDISPAEALAYLQRIGYLEDTALFYLERADLDRSREQVKERMALLKDRYLANLLSDAEAQREMVQLGFSAEQISRQLAAWKQLINKNAKLPSKSDFDKFLRSGLIGEVEYRAEMGKLGYSKHYTDLYFAYVTHTGEMG